jgi:hypothetical protein
MSIQDIHTPDLVTETHINKSSIDVKLVGTAESSSMEQLGNYLQQLHDTASTSKLREVIVDLRGLEFMNSSCFKKFVTWMSNLQDTPPESQYNVRFVSDERKHWQSRSLGALACFAVDLIRLENA